MIGCARCAEHRRTSSRRSNEGVHMTEEVKVGDQGKDFVLESHTGEKVALSEHRGKKVLLSFHPLAWTKICGDQMKSLEENKERFDELDAVAFGISVDTVPSKKAWAEELGIENTQLLCDFWPHGKMIKDYGLFRDEDGFSQRANIIIDEEGKMIFKKVYPIRELPDIEEIIEEMR